MPLDYLDARQLEAFVAVMSIGSMTGCPGAPQVATGGHKADPGP